MFRYVTHEIFHTALVAFGVVTLVFAALRLSGDPAATKLRGGPLSGWGLRVSGPGGAAAGR